MPKILDVITQSINNDMQKFSNVSHNIANVNTTGFKAIDLVNKEINVGQLQSALEAKLNMANGTMKKTERALDFAIQGDGFFQIETSDGSQFLTRNGSFTLDENLNLLTTNGHSVMGQQGPIQLLDENFLFTANGDIISNGQVVNSFKLMTPTNMSALEYTGSSLYKIAANEPMQEIEHSQIKQGALEASNISASTQMIELIQISRHLQSNQKALLAYDHILNSGINTLGQR